MKSRAFAYNPSQVPVSGTISHGTLLIEDLSQDYSSKPGEAVWWQGPDEDLGYVIAATVPAGNHPTPVGNVGTVRFWRTQSFNDFSFLGLANFVSGHNFLDTASAVTWLESNSYWTSYQSSFSLVSQYEAKVESSYPSPYTGSTWYDLSAQNNDATLSSPNFDIETFQMYFNNSYASIGQPIPSNSSYSIVAWVYPFSVVGARNIVSSQDSPFWISNGTLYAGVGGNYTAVSEAGLVDSTYYFVAMTFDDANNTMTLYLNGSQVDQNTSVTQTYSAQNTFIGSHYSGGMNVSFFEGFINYVGIYTGVLPSSYVQSIYDNTVGTYGT